jgi:hypothetical protein
MKTNSDRSLWSTQDNGHWGTFVTKPHKIFHALKIIWLSTVEILKHKSTVDAFVMARCIFKKCSFPTQICESSHGSSVEENSSDDVTVYTW